jgi:hypothetical protein
MLQLIIAGLSLATACFSSPASARVERIEILSRQAFAAGTEFSHAGAYEKLRGRAFFALDPDAAANGPIADLKLAPRNNRGRQRADRANMQGPPVSWRPMQAPCAVRLRGRPEEGAGTQDGPASHRTLQNQSVCSGARKYRMTYSALECAHGESPHRRLCRHPRV